VKIYNPEEGIIDFELYPFQENKILPVFDREQFVILKKCRQSGLSTLSVIYCFWKSLFWTDQKTLIISKTDEDAQHTMGIVHFAWEYLPDWMKCRTLESNKHVLRLETESEIRCGTSKRGRGFSINYAIIDESGFIPDMEEVWKGIFPTISAAGANCKVFVVSTVNGTGNWYYDTWTKAVQKKNSFYALDIQYTEHPKYNDPLWVKKMKENMGPRGWDQEVLGIFLSSSDTFIRPERIKELDEAIRNNPVVPKKLFNDKLWVYSKPKPGRSYILSADVAEGLGGEHDASTFHVLDMVTLEQVAEFCCNSTTTYQFAKIINELGNYYNEATVVVENNALGVAVLQKLENDLDYENLYYGSSGKKAKVGFTMSGKTRPLVLNLLSNLIENRHVKIKSERLFNELQVFEYNTAQGRAEARKGKHDDLIMALAIGLFARNSIISETPIGAINVDLDDPDFEPTFDMSHSSVLSNKSSADEDDYEEVEEEEEVQVSAPVRPQQPSFTPPKRKASRDFPGMDSIEIISSDDDDEALLREFGW
jgi:hypothetical protein